MAAIGILGSNGRMGQAIAARCSPMIARRLGRRRRPVTAMPTRLPGDATCWSISRRRRAAANLDAARRRRHPDPHRHDRARRRGHSGDRRAPRRGSRCCRPPTCRSASTCSRIWSSEAAHGSAPDWDVEIVEMHHRHKLDAPSGTALAARRRGGCRTRRRRSMRRASAAATASPSARPRRDRLRLAARRIGGRRSSGDLRGRGRTARARPPRREPRDLRARARSRRRSGSPASPPAAIR